jgi:hypothetical protein
MPRTLAALALLALAAGRPGSARAAEVDALLRRADAYRLPAGAMQVDTQLETFRAGALDKERRYLVWIQPGRRSLVLSRSPAERGQKVLMLEDDFWIVLPSSQRPIRITPAQKLLGDAAAGDVATMAWADDYQGVVVGEVEVGGIPCLRLDLRARRKGVTYQRVELWLARGDARPVQADLYLASDKLAKRATFTLEQVDGRTQVSSMTLVDQIQTSRRTVIRYLARRPRTLPAEFFNPMFLTRNEPRD